HAFFVPLVACALGATASGAVILSLVGPPTTQPGVSSISPRAIVRNASKPTKTAQDRPMAETPLPPAVTSGVPGRDELVAQTKAERQAEVHSQQSRKHSQQRSRGRYWQGRFARFFAIATLQQLVRRTADPAAL